MLEISVSFAVTLLANRRLMLDYVNVVRLNGLKFGDKLPNQSMTALGSSGSWYRFTCSFRRVS